MNFKNTVTVKILAFLARILLTMPNLKTLFFIAFFVFLGTLNNACNMKQANLNLNDLTKQSQQVKRKTNLADINKVMEINAQKNLQKTYPIYELKDLEPREQELIKAAHSAMDNSYSPYSNFQVGAALEVFNLTDADKSIITGTNFENAAYGSTICAERAAILRANALNGEMKASSIAIIGKPEGGNADEPIAPCGACRQVIFELSQRSDRNMTVYMSNSNMTKIRKMKIYDLLPFAFGPKDLE